MKQIHIRLNDDTLELLTDFMEAKGYKTISQTIVKLMLLGIQQSENKQLAEFSKELRELKREVAGTNERIDLMMKLDQGPNKGN